MIPLAIPDLRGRESELVAQCVADNWVSSAGPFVTAFEQALADLTGRAGVVPTMNGTAALHLAVVPDWTFAATANAVYMAHAEPVFVDLDPQSWTLDPALLDAVLSVPPVGTSGNSGPITAVIAVDAMGHPYDADALEAVCARHGVPLIEDGAGAIGSLYHPPGGTARVAGALGRLSCFSFNGNKLVTCGGGGAVFCDDPDLAARVRHLSTQARVGMNYTHDEVGFNYRMTNVNAAIGMAQLERLDEMVTAKQQIAARYDAALAGRSDVGLMPRLDWATTNCWLYGIRVGDAASAQALVAHLTAAGVQGREFWRSLCVQEPYAGAARALNGVSAALTGTVVSLPCSSQLTEAEQQVVLDALASWKGASVQPIAPLQALTSGAA
jgi:dTDP-4-amino-4,6-dideoxygalactose transaminase